MAGWMVRELEYIRKRLHIYFNAIGYKPESDEIERALTHLDKAVEIQNNQFPEKPVIQ